MFYYLFKSLKIFVAWLDWLLLTLILYSCSFLPAYFTQSWYHWAFRRWCWAFVRAIGVELRLHQKNRFALPQQYLLIGNHPSAFEDIGMPALFNVRFLAKIEVKTWWVLGRISTAAGTLYVERESKDSRKAASLEIIDALNSGHNIGLYPEGGCKGRRIFLPFRYGTFEAAIQTKIPIVPVLLHYEAQEDFEWGPHETLLQKIWTMMKSSNKVVNYYVFDAINPTLFKDKQALCAYTQELYLEWQKKYLE